ncbi:hypothetical protein HELRODRAFT_177446 [Helobdella robusta]|uniref:Uncharacterized protein n=1 Tax=Helobdella robusta TaxID=6412 RepID=T1FBQ1_HELRO|nr:hypothetical protein HELRODRAFT_177446 [Helobdella robusta]ESN97822.1 hypothetical protein HELRODRAFT_177446 [Helobdella robusta]
MKLQLKKCVTSQFSSKEAQLPLPDNEVKRCDERIKDGDDLSFENVDSETNNSDDNSYTDNAFTAKINSNSFYHTGNNRTQDGNKVLDNFTKVKKSLSEVEEPKRHMFN